MAAPVFGIQVLTNSNLSLGLIYLFRLTAFVLRIFSQADGLVGMYIDDRVQQDAIGFIEAQQKSDGSFPPVCNVINRDMLECSEGSCSLTAYVTLSLLEAGISPEVASKLNFLISINIIIIIIILLLLLLLLLLC